MPRILTVEDTRLSDIQKAEIETTNSILELIKSVDENAIENSDKNKLLISLLTRVSNDSDIIDALNLYKAKNQEESENKESSDKESDDDFDFNM